MVVDGAETPQIKAGKCHRSLCVNWGDQADWTGGLVEHHGIMGHHSGMTMTLNQSGRMLNATSKEPSLPLKWAGNFRANL